MKKYFLISILAGLPALAWTQNDSKAKAIPTPASLVPQTSVIPNEGGRMPFSNEEAKFYNKAWPIRETHSLYALILMGSVLAVLFTILVRKMAQSGPRKPSEK